MANAFSDLVNQDCRLVILRALEQDSDYTHNEGVLQSMLAQVGHGISQDNLRTHLAWLEEQGLVELSEVGAIRVAKITARGVDVALGRATVPGVKRPGPSD